MRIENIKSKVIQNMLYSFLKENFLYKTCMLLNRYLLKNKLLLTFTYLKLS